MYLGNYISCNRSCSRRDNGIYQNEEDKATSSEDIDFDGIKGDEKDDSKEDGVDGNDKKKKGESNDKKKSNQGNALVLYKPPPVKKEKTE